MRQAFYILILIAMLIVLFGNEAVGSQSIRIHTSASVEAGDILLADIADVQADDAELLEKLSCLSVAQIGRGGSAVLVGAYEISASLQSIGVIPASFSIHGASRCEVSCLTEVQEVAAPVESLQDTQASEAAEQELARNAAMASLEQRLNAAVSRIMGLPVVSLRSEWRCQNADLLEALAGGGRIISAAPLRSVSLGRVQFTITIADLSGMTMSYDVAGRVLYVCRSVVAMRTLGVGEVIAPNDVRLEIREVSDLNDVGINDLSQVVNQEVARGIRAGQAIGLDSVRKIQLITRRDIVEVVHRAGAINLRFRGRALSGGGLGDVVQVHNESTDTIVEGRITAAGTVSVGLSESSNNNAAGLRVAQNSNFGQVYYMER